MYSSSSLIVRKSEVFSSEAAEISDNDLPLLEIDVFRGVGGDAEVLWWSSPGIEAIVAFENPMWGW
ncbi:hypothetical protein JMJ77_0011376 [Colletotrichum scovillei]|uniref:Uncharacterized protein n=1 Tax=Colletotrichum scovillei TaxID=1209932 RepID=A0A9P7UAJ6_9PEZI|nr:hypothetical protein JMJ78_0008066 [Colletotrichum scovillei]KAG7040512.1 hypothetical protein JMJ77_0011376 [Colletotrichum scovillei]KAG7060560.1 hypothetical protein JMJ76_0012133 [Colletotrichum scovillei]